MRIGELIAFVDEGKPNQYSAQLKTVWLSEVEGMVIDQILNTKEGFDITFKGYDYERDSERELLVPRMFADLYVNYLEAKIDYKNGETERYNNSVAMFEAAYQNYAAYCMRNYMPKNKAQFRGW